MKKLLLLILILVSVKATVFASDIDSLKQQLQLNLTDSAKADLYLKMAKAYVELKAPNNVYRDRNGENAVNYTMLALHIYSRMEDSTGLKNSYVSLSKAYRLQHRYTQAKWFMVQSSVIAKSKKDIPGMIASLVELAGIKNDAGEYLSAKKDLNYALRLTSKYNVPDYQLDITQALAIANNGIKSLPEDEAINDTNSSSSTIIIDNVQPKVIAVKATTKTSKIKSKKLFTTTKKVHKPVPVTNDLAAL